MTTIPKPQTQGNEAQLRQLLLAQKVSAAELDGLLDRYAAAALAGRPGARSPQEAEARRGRWT